MSKKLAIAFLFVAASARADFDSLVRVVESSRGMHRVWTPGISFVRLGVRMVHPEGVHDFQLAIFEGHGDVDIERVMRAAPGVPIVRTRDNRTGETAVIWAHPLSADLVEMLLVAHDPNDNTVVIRAVVDGQKLAEEIADPRHAASIAGE
jgi:hypothetical protein